MFCSAAGFATRAVMTAAAPSGEAQMLVVPLNIGERVEPLIAPLQGMRAAVTGMVDFTGCVIAADACLGSPGDYHQEPDFSGFSSITFGLMWLTSPSRVITRDNRMITRYPGFV